MHFLSNIWSLKIAYQTRKWLSKRHHRTRFWLSKSLNRRESGRQIFLPDRIFLIGKIYDHFDYAWGGVSPELII